MSDSQCCSSSSDSCCSTATASDAASSSTNDGRGHSVYLETFGCQMNELDSELVRGHLKALGYRFTPDAEEAEVVLYNTCSVREQAENKVRSRIGLVSRQKEAGRSVIVGVLGCMAEREGAALLQQFPQVDLMCGPGELDKLPLLLDNVFRTDAAASAEDRVALQGSTTRRSSTLAAAEDDLELLDLSRAFDPNHAEAGGRSAYVRITRGCNKFCTYCVVPNTRGPEVHRPPDAIVEECRRLADQGVIEVTLLGQTINHYVYVHGTAITVGGAEAPQVGPGLKAFRSNGGPSSLGSKVTTFADLLHRIHEEVPGILRLRFVTSYPRDFSDEALQVMAESDRICEYLHVPAQSGSNDVLKRMNRGYTVEEYLEFIDRARSFMPDVSIAGDIIVGFPGETDDDFELTRQLVRRVGFKNNFIFKYSPRPGTVAIDRFADDIPDEVKRYRNNVLLADQAEVSAAAHASWVGKTVDVFVEQESVKSVASGGLDQRIELGWAKDRVQMSGRTGGDLITFFDLPSGMSPGGLVGRVVPVEVTGSGALRLEGVLAVGAEASIR